jgi:hypothetical protein
LLVSKGWIQAVALVVLFGFLVMGLLAYRTYQAEPPIPVRVVDERGGVVFTGDDVRSGQHVLLRNGLMQYGSIFGHGAYLGPDWTADYLHRAAEAVTTTYGGVGSDTARARTRSEFKANRYDARSGALTISDAQAAAFRSLADYYHGYFAAADTSRGAASRRDYRPWRHAPAHRVLRVVGVGVVDQPARARLLVHQQLAAGAAGRQRADREHGDLVDALPGRAAGRHRAAVRGVRALAGPRLARA